MMTMIVMMMMMMIKVIIILMIKIIKISKGKILNLLQIQSTLCNMNCHVCTLLRSRHNQVQIMCNSFGASCMQHVMHHIGQRGSSAVNVGS